MDDESMEGVPPLGKRKRSSILRPPEKRSRDSRTVSFFLGEDMDLTLMDVVEPNFDNRTINSVMSMSMATNSTLSEERMIEWISEISSFNDVTMADPTALNESFFGAFHDSNNISIQSRTSGVDTLMHNIEALNECIQKVDEESKESRRRLDEEMEELFKFYRHIINKDNKYQFAIKIFGLRYSLWLIIEVNPETYPNEKLDLKFAVNKKDRHLYPFSEFAEAVRRCTIEGRNGYLTKLVINAQKFRRFLRSIGYRKQNN